MVGSSCAPQAVVLSKTQTLGLLAELYAGYASEDFQRQLQELAKNSSTKGCHDLRCVEGRQALTLAVQKQVLPRYGFAGDEDGVLAMKMAVRKHMGDPRIARKSMDIRDKLLIPEVKKDVSPPAAGQELTPTPAPPSPAPAPVAAPAQPARVGGEVAAIKKDQEIEVMVQHARGHGQLVVRIPAEGTMLQVKEAVIAAIGRGKVTDVQLVMWGGGMFVNHRDCDTVNTERVFSTGIDLRGIN